MVTCNCMAICGAHEIFWVQRSRLYHFWRHLLSAIHGDDITAPEMGQPCNSGRHDCLGLFVASKDAEHGGLFLAPSNMC